MTNKNELRIIAGLWRSRKIAFPDGLNLRPTPDRVRETLFNWLRDDVVGAECLDLFAGSGALGFEALSRGASRCIFVDSNPEAIDAIEAMAEKVGSTEHETFCQTAESWLDGSVPKPFDIIFLDPPYDNPLIEPTLVHLIEQGALNPNALIYVESDKPLEELTLPEGMDWHKQSKAAQVNFGLLQYKAEEL